MQPITISTRILHVMHNHHMHKSKTSYANSSIGAICTGACLAPRKMLASGMLHDVVLQALLQWSPLAELLL
jgi:hypothetical protein